MGLDGSPRSSEGRRETDVGHAGDEQPLPSGRGTCGLPDAAEDRVHAVRRKQLVLDGNVRRGDAQAPAAPGPSLHAPLQREGAAQEPFRLLHLPGRHEPPDPAARDLRAVQRDLVNHLNAERQPRAQILEPGEGRLPPLSKMKIVPHVHLHRAQAAVQHVADELLRALPGELRREGLHDRDSDPLGGDQGELLAERHDEGRAPLGGQDALRVGIERVADRGAADRERSRDHGAEDLLMADMDAVEIPDGHDGRGEAWGEMGAAVDDLHGASTVDEERPNAGDPPGIYAPSPGRAPRKRSGSVRPWHARCRGRNYTIDSAPRPPEVPPERRADKI